MDFSQDSVMGGSGRAAGAYPGSLLSQDSNYGHEDRLLSDNGGYLSQM
jgi:hypothetical protein